MDEKMVAALEHGGGIIPVSFIRTGVDGIRQTSKLWRSVINSRRLPENGWKPETLDGFLKMISSLDTNNAVDNVGVGEREARIYCAQVAKRHFGLIHGVGRGGNLTAAQPKAAGSSILVVLCNAFALQILRQQGAASTRRALVVPVATGRVVLWLRCDQASAPKAVALSGCTLVCVEGRPEGSAVTTDMDALREAARLHGASSVLCVLSTTSCFSPRTPDDVLSIARFCREQGIAHVINNAYGVQSRHMMKMINGAQREGRVDAYVQSTDKNFMVPVGGSVIASADKQFVDGLASDYAGRASASPMLDLLMTLLSMGSAGYAALIDKREENWLLAKQKLSNMGFPPLEVKANDISMALSLEHLSGDAATTKLGSMLFSRSISGHRVVTVGDKTKSLANGVELKDWGTSGALHCQVYITVAIAIGMTLEDINIFCRRLSKLVNSNGSN